MKIVSLPAIAALITLGLAAPAHADEQWAVSKIKYKNNGSYEAYFNFAGKYANGYSYECDGMNTKGTGIKQGQSVTIRIDNSDKSYITGEDEDCSGPVGGEVWGVAYLDRGNNYSEFTKRKNCRKDGNKFYYHPDGGTVEFRSGGTLENNNRCKLGSKGGVKWDPEIHGSIK